MIQFVDGLNLFHTNVTNIPGNVAFGKSATQSRTWGGHGASRAVDGDTTPDINSGHCAHPSRSNNRKAWWMVDLGQQHVIQYVTLFGRDSKFLSKKNTKP